MNELASNLLSWINEGVRISAKTRDIRYLNALADNNPVTLYIYYKFVQGIVVSLEPVSDNDEEVLEVSIDRIHSGPVMHLEIDKDLYEVQDVGIPFVGIVMAALDTVNGTFTDAKEAAKNFSMGTYKRHLQPLDDPLYPFTVAKSLRYEDGVELGYCEGVGIRLEKDEVVIYKGPSLVPDITVKWGDPGKNEYLSIIHKDQSLRSLCFMHSPDKNRERDEDYFLDYIQPQLYCFIEPAIASGNQDDVCLLVDRLLSRELQLQLDKDECRRIKNSVFETYGTYATREIGLSKDGRVSADGEIKIRIYEWDADADPNYLCMVGRNYYSYENDYGKDSALIMIGLALAGAMGWDTDDPRVDRLVWACAITKIA